jgi:hypothetical protein
VIGVTDERDVSGSGDFEGGKQTSEPASEYQNLGL